MAVHEPDTRFQTITCVSFFFIFVVFAGWLLEAERSFFFSATLELAAYQADARFQPSPATNKRGVFHMSGIVDNPWCDSIRS